MVVDSVVLLQIQIVYVSKNPAFDDRLTFALNARAAR